MLPLNFAVAFIATCAFWLFGYDMSVMVGPQKFLLNSFPPEPSQGGVITEEPFSRTRSPSTLGIAIAAFELGALVGALVGALSCLGLGDRLGRGSTVSLGMTFMIIGGTLQTSAWHVVQLTVGRVISVIGLGLRAATVPS